jgi:MFS family permease
MLQNAGYGIGALVAGALVVTASTGVYLLAAALNAVTFLASAVLLLLPTAGTAASVRGPDERRAQQPAGYRMLLRDRPYLLLILANTAFAVCAVFLSVGLPVYIVDGLHAPGWIAGVVLAVNTVLLSVAQLAATRLVRPLSRVGALALAGALWTAWSLLTAAAVGVPAAWLAGYLIAIVALFSAAELIHAPVSNALAAEAAPEQARGSYLAAFQYGFTIATVVVPGAFAFLFELGPALPWIVVAAVAAAGAVIMPTLRSRIPVSAV